jgi:LmbE family N-acetylglucosaminyl deacetylase
MARVDGEVPTRALAVYGHPDDPEISAGGTLAKWADAGTEVWVVVCGLGDKGSPDPASDPAALARRRRRETEAAAGVLGVSGHRYLGYADGEIDNTRELRATLVRTIRELRPEVVLCPDPTAVFFGDGYVNHRDHRMTGWATLDAVAPAAGNPHYFPEQIAEGLAAHTVRRVYLSGTVEPNTWVDVTATIERKVDAIFCHESQLVDTGEWFREWLRERAQDVGRAVGVPFAEAFRRLDL